MVGYRDLQPGMIVTSYSWYKKQDGKVIPDVVDSSVGKQFLVTDFGEEYIPCDSSSGVNKVKRQVTYIKEI